MILRSGPLWLEEILAGPDEYGLLAGVLPLPGKAQDPADVAARNFLEIVEFVDAYGREPGQDGKNGEGPSSERLLAIRLAAFRNTPELAERVRLYDRHDLLPPKAELAAQPAAAAPPTSLEEIFASDSSGLLDEIDPSIFRIRHPAEKNIPDEIASRKPCGDFFRYEKMFRDIHKLLGTPAAIASRYRSRHGAAVGSVFVLRGLLCYIDSVISKEGSGPGNPRLRVIFENATETDLLKNSLVRALFKDEGAKFVDLAPRLDSAGAPQVTARNRPTGYVYILETLCRDKAIARYKNSRQLVKIGYCAQEVEERIKNAENDPTFLEAPVKIMARFTCFNLDPRKFEHLIHAFLHNQRLCIELRDKNGQSYRPREWFTVDWRTAAEACRHIIDGTINQYRMDNANSRMVKKEAK